MTKNYLLHSLRHEVDQPVRSFLQTKKEEIYLDDYLGAEVQITHTGRKFCISCGKYIKKTYASGYCYPCFTTTANNDICFVRPERCHFEQGTCREPSFGESYCMQPHLVYLALTSGIKVGITRKGQEMNRWLSQGAISAVPILEVPTRKLAGMVEHHLSESFADKTNWRKMLKNEGNDLNLLWERERAFAHIPEWAKKYQLLDEKPRHFHYTGQVSTDKIVSHNLTKAPIITGTILGTKGQYLILDSGVLQVRSHAGYEISWQIA